MACLEPDQRHRGIAGALHVCPHRSQGFGGACEETRLGEAGRTGQQIHVAALELAEKWVRFNPQKCHFFRG